jgi:hypothetical protein
MEKDRFLINRARDYLELFERFIDGLHYAYEALRVHLKGYESRQDPQTTVDLQSSVAHFERFVLPLISSQEAEERPYAEDSGVLTLGVDGYWRAYEFRQFFDSVDYLHKLCTIRHKLERRAPDLRLRRGMTRSVVYRRARLYYYLSPREELQVRQIRFSSPGLVNFEGVGEVLKEVRELVDYIITFKWFKGIIDTYDYLAYGRKVEREKSRLEYAQTKSKLKEVVRQLRQRESQDALEHIEQYHQALERLNQIADLMIELDKKGLAHLPTVERTFMRSVSMLHRLGYEDKKVKSQLPSSLDTESGHKSRYP